MLTRQQVEVDAVRRCFREACPSWPRRVQLKSAPVLPCGVSLNQSREPFERGFAAFDKDVSTLAVVIVHYADVQLLLSIGFHADHCTALVCGQVNDMCRLRKVAAGGGTALHQHE